MKNKKLITYEEFWEYLSACYTKINLANYHHKFEKDSYLIATDRILLDALHTLIDGYTLNDNGKEIIELKLDPRIKSEIKTKKAGFEFMRSALTHKFIRLGQGCVSDYFHLLKLSRINLRVFLFFFNLYSNVIALLLFLNVFLKISIHL